MPRFFLIHVIQDPVRQCTVDFCIDEELFIRLQAQMCESARSAIRKQLEKFPYIDPEKVTTDIKTGTPYDQILTEAEERGADLIVISSLGTSGPAKYLIGSVARHVLLGAKCPVLLTK